MVRALSVCWHVLYFSFEFAILSRFISPLEAIITAAGGEAILRNHLARALSQMGKASRLLYYIGGGVHQVRDGCIIQRFRELPLFYTAVVIFAFRPNHTADDTWKIIIIAAIEVRRLISKL